MIVKEKNQVLWSNTAVAFATALFCCVLWGSATPAIKIAYKLFGIATDDTASRLMLSGARFMIAGLMIILFASLMRKKILLPKKTSFGKIALLSMFQTVGQYYFFFMALANTTGVRGSIINALGNFLAILFAAYIFRMEKMTLQKWIGCIIGFAGIVLILGGGEAIMAGNKISASGEGAMIVADIFYALSGCCIKIFSKDEDPVVLSAYQFLMGGAILYLFGIVMGGSLVFSGVSCVGNLIYMGFISAGAYTLWGILLKYNPVSKISIMGFLNPVMGVLLSALFLGENKEAFSIVGIGSLVLVAMGIYVVNKIFVK
ncbi:MAG: DMT family transporter [Lachnospiraceae bacterium]|nr:DMT family transporter [Lachnospiraceae bacterium]